MFGKIVAISTVKHLSRNYAFFSNQVCKSGIAYPLLVRHKVFRKGTPLTFMEMDTSCRTQETFKDLRTASKVVCDVNSEYRRIQVNSVGSMVFLPYPFIIQIHFF